MSMALGLTPEESEVRESEENKFRKKKHRSKSTIE